MTRRDLISLMLSATAFSLIGCAKRRTSFRYRMTVMVDTPDGPRSGSSVINVGVAQGVAFPGPEAGGIGGRVRGEAVAIDLPSGKTVFALLSGENGVGAAGYPEAALIQERPDRGGDGEAYFHNVEIMKTRKQRAELPREFYPRLVWFRDLKNPNSVEQVSADAFPEDLASQARVKNITIQLSDDAVTDGIFNRLPWLRALGGKYLDGGTTNKNAPLGLHTGDFSMGIFL